MQSVLLLSWISAVGHQRCLLDGPLHSDAEEEDQGGKQ